MPGYYLHLAACNKKALSNRSFVLGVEAPDILKKYIRIYGNIDEVRTKYESLCTPDMPEFNVLETRIQQKEIWGSTDGLHYGLSSQPNVMACWSGLSISEKTSPFWRGYVWHLLTDAIMYGRLEIDTKFQKFLETNKGNPNIEELKKSEVKKLHTDWDKTNAHVRNAYPEITLPNEIKELNVVQFIEDGELVYVSWPLLKKTIEYLRTFDPMEGDMDTIITQVMNSI